MMADKNKNREFILSLEKNAVPLTGAMSDYDAIINAAADKQFVLIGEASHGTKEFYAIRAEITKRLIQEQGFEAVAVEADWPDAYNVNRYVSSASAEGTPQEALATFERFPTWMWRNEEVLNFITWLHDWNHKFALSDANKKYFTGFYGLDLYSLNASIHAVIGYLDQIDANAARRARERYGCLYHFMDNPQDYGLAVQSEPADSCEEEIVSQLVDLHRKEHDYLERDGLDAEASYFYAAQNAKVVKNAEHYYRSMFTGKANSWNVRDEHMFDTLKDLSNHLGKTRKQKPKIVVWAHNSHIGNAAATEMGKYGETNIGKLVLDAYGAQSLRVGFSTSHGTVTAATNWDEPPETKNVNLPFPGSYEEIFHQVNHKNFLINLREDNSAIDLLMQPRLERAIGVVYRPMTERQSHYFQACMPEQFDFMIHIDRTTAVQPLEAIPRFHKGDMDETYPFGI